MSWDATYRKGRGTIKKCEWKGLYSLFVPPCCSSNKARIFWWWVGGKGCYRRLNGSANFPPPEVVLKPAWGPGQHLFLRECQFARAEMWRCCVVETGHVLHGHISASRRLHWQLHGSSHLVSASLGFQAAHQANGREAAGGKPENSRPLARGWKHVISCSIQLQVACHETVRAQLLLLCCAW